MENFPGKVWDRQFSPILLFSIDFMWNGIILTLGCKTGNLKALISGFYGFICFIIIYFDNC